MHQVIDKMVTYLYLQILIYILLCSKKEVLDTNTCTEKSLKYMYFRYQDKGNRTTEKE